jgi:hypothetical protein
VRGFVCAKMELHGDVDIHRLRIFLA